MSPDASFGRRLLAGWLAIAGRFGEVQTLVVLAFSYALLLGPFALAAAAARRDLLDRRRLGQATSAWHPADSSEPDLERLKHPF